MTLTNNDKNNIANTRGPDKIAPNYMFLVDWAKNVAKQALSSSKNINFRRSLRGHFRFPESFTKSPNVYIC